MKNNEGKLVNFNINIKAETDEEAFRNSPAKYENMLKSLYQLAQVMTEKTINPDEKKKVRHSRNGFTYGVVAILALISKNRDSDNVATSAGIVNELVNAAEDESALQNFASIATDISTGIEIGSTGKRIHKASKDIEVKIMRSVDGKLRDQDMQDLPQNIKDEIMKILGGKKDGD